MAEELMIGDRVVVDPDQWEKCGQFWPDIDPKIEMTIVGKHKHKKIAIYVAWSDKCPCCGHRRQTMNNFAALWFKKIADAPAGTSQESITQDVQNKIAQLNEAMYERRATGPGTEGEG